MRHALVGGGSVAQLQLDGVRWRAYVRFLIRFGCLFVPVYGGMAWWSGLGLQTPLHLYLGWELALPWVPWMVWPYVSLYLLYVLPLLHLRADEMEALSRQSTLALLAAALGFALVPAANGFAPPQGSGLSAEVLASLRQLDSAANLVPSLHVVFSVLILQACRARVRPGLSWLYVGWMALLISSTVLTHQHHLLDVLCGLALAWGVRRLVPISSRADGVEGTRPAQSR